MKYRLSVNWVWREEFDYEVPEDTKFPDDWDSMSPTNKMIWIEPFECEFNERYPIAVLEIVGVDPL